MTLTEKTYTLAAERNRIDGELDRLADALVDAEDDTVSAQHLRQRASSLETQLGGLQWLITEYGEDATITVGGLDAGEYAQVQDRAESYRAQQDGDSGVPGARRNVFAAMGVVDAPFLDREAIADADDPLGETLDAVTSLPVGVADWLESRANELTTVSEGDFRSFSERLKARSTD